MHALKTAAPLLFLLLAACGGQEESTRTSGQLPAVNPAAMGPATPTPPAADPGRLKYAGVCLGCHGPDAKGQGPFPKLTGKPAAELAAMLQDYRAGKPRGPQSDTMMPFAKPLTDEEIQALANYLASR
ncbi:MAG: c-type cytochrome [Pseudomonadota bacterium]